MGAAVKPVGKLDVRNGHVQFDERGRETTGGLEVPVKRPSSTLRAPIRRRSLVEEDSTHVIVGRHGSYRAAWLGNWPGRSLGTKVRFRRASDPAGRNASEA